MSYLRLLWIFLRIGAMNELAYRANFWAQLLQSLVNLGVALGGLAVIFGQTEALGGWQPAEMVALLGVFFLMSGLIGSLISPSMSHLIDFGTPPSGSADKNPSSRACCTHLTRS